MADEPIVPAPQYAPGVTRRQSLALAAGILTLGTALGIPRSALALSGSSRFQLKFYADDSRLLASADMPTSVSEYLVSPQGSRVQMKLYHGDEGELGALQLSDPVRTRLERLQGKERFDRQQLKIDATQGRSPREE
jgi:hypothetical protein